MNNKKKVFPKSLSSSKIKKMQGMVYWTKNHAKPDNIEKIHEEHHQKAQSSSKSKQAFHQINFRKQEK